MTAITAAMVKQLRDQTGVGIMACKAALVAANGDVQKAIEELRKAGRVSAAKKATRLAAEGKLALGTNADHTAAWLIEVNCETDFVAKDTHFTAFVEKLISYAVAHHVRAVEALQEQFEADRLELIARTGENILIRRMVFLEGPYVNGYLHSGRIGVLVSARQASLPILKEIGMHIAAMQPDYLEASDISEDVLAHERSIHMEAIQRTGKSVEMAEKIAQGKLNKWLEDVVLVKQPYVKRAAGSSETVGEFLNRENAVLEAFVRLVLGEGLEALDGPNFAEEVAAMTKG